MLGSSSSTGSAADAVHHPGCSSAGPRRKRLKTSHSLQRFANRFVDPWAFPAIQLDELTIEVVVETRGKANTERSSSCATSSETIRPFKTEAKRPKPASSVAKVLPVSPTKLRTASEPQAGVSQFDSKNICEIKPEEGFGRLETKNFNESLEATEENFRKSSALHELSPAYKRKRDQPDEIIVNKAIEGADHLASVKPIFTLDANSQFVRSDAKEINGHVEIRDSSLPSISNTATNTILITESRANDKIDVINLPLMNGKFESLESTLVKPARYGTIPQTTRSVPSTVTKSTAMVVPTAKAPSQTVAAVRPQPTSQLVVIQSEQTAAVSLHQPLTQVTSLSGGVVPNKSWVPTVVPPAPPSYYVVDQNPPLQFYTPAPTAPQVFVETGSPVVPAEVLQICNPVNSSGLPVLQATNGLSALQPLTLMPAPVAQQQQFASTSQAVVPSGFRQAGPHNQLPRTSQSCSPQPSCSAPLVGTLSALTHHGAACAGQRPLIMPDLSAETNATDVHKGASSREFSYLEKTNASNQHTENDLCIMEEASMGNVKKFCVDYCSSDSSNLSICTNQFLTSPLNRSRNECARTRSFEDSSRNLLNENKCATCSTSILPQPSSSPLPESFSPTISEDGQLFSPDIMEHRNPHLGPNDCSRNSSLISSFSPIGVERHSSSANCKKCSFEHASSQLSARKLNSNNITKNGFKMPLSDLRKDCFLHELDGLVGQSSFSKLFLSKFEHPGIKTKTFESSMKRNSVTALHAILDNFFTRSCCSVLSHLASLCRKFSVSKLFHWQVARGFTYGLKVPRLQPALLCKKGRKSSLMALLCFRKVKNEKQAHLVDSASEKNINLCHSFSPPEFPTGKSLVQNRDSTSMEDAKQQAVDVPKDPDVLISTGLDPEGTSNIDDNLDGKLVSSSSVQERQCTPFGRLHSENGIIEEVPNPLLKSSHSPMKKLPELSDQSPDTINLTELPSKSLCTFDATALFSNSFDFSFSSIARHFECEAIETDESQTDQESSDQPVVHRGSSEMKTSIIPSTRNDSNFDQSWNFSKPEKHSSDISTSAANSELTTLGTYSHTSAATPLHQPDLTVKKPFSRQKLGSNEHNEPYQRAKDPDYTVSLPRVTRFEWGKNIDSRIFGNLPNQESQKCDQIDNTANGHRGTLDHQVNVDIETLHERTENATDVSLQLLPEDESQTVISETHTSRSVISPTSVTSCFESTLSFGKLTFSDASEILSLKENSQDRFDGFLSYQEKLSQLKIETNPGKVDTDLNNETDEIVSVASSPSSPSSDVSSVSNMSECDAGDAASALVELPNDDAAYEELLRSGYEVEKPSLRFPSETRLGLNGRISYKIYGKVKSNEKSEKNRKKKKKKREKLPSEIEKGLKKKLKCHIAQQTVNDIISARPPTEMPSHIIVSVQGKLFMYGDEVL